MGLYDLCFKRWFFVSAEGTHVVGQRIAANGVGVLNTAFDVALLRYVSAIICESGVYGKKDFARFKANSST